MLDKYYDALICLSQQVIEDMCGCDNEILSLIKYLMCFWLTSVIIKFFFLVKTKNSKMFKFQLNV